MSIMIHQATPDLDQLNQQLSAQAELANEAIPFDEVNPTTAHPLHRICDAVFAGRYDEETAISIARIYLQHGADINGGPLVEKQDTPLIAAASLLTDRLAIFYIENGADIAHAGTHGGTALHWAAWCARPVVTRKLIDVGASINMRCMDFHSTPLFWAVHGYAASDRSTTKDYLAVVQQLLEAGADKTIPNSAGKTVMDLLTRTDQEMRTLLTLPQ